MDADRTWVLTGGAARTLDPGRPRADAVVVRGNRIVAVLDDPADAPAGARRVDLEGGCVLPGLTDAHVHFPSWATSRRELALHDAASVADVARAVAGARPGPAGWVRGRGWRDATWAPGDVPTRQALDAVAPGVPVALRARDGHSLWLNSAALAHARGDLAVRGGVVEVDERGEPTGVLREESAWRFQARHVEPSHEEALEAMREAQPVAAAAGVTAIHDKDGGRGAPELFAALEAAGELALRVWQSLPADALDALHATGRRPDPADGRLLRVGYLKAFMDGTLGSMTARLLDGSGVQITSRDALADIVRRAAALDWPVAVHAIGDRANREALDAFEATAGVWRPRGLRHRIEHAQCLHPDDVGRFARLGVAASIQYTHATSDRELVERLWADRIEHAYPFRGLRDSGAVLAGGSDAPVEELAPLDGLRAAVLRTMDDRPPWRPEQGVDLETAVASFTVAPAWLTGEEAARGRLRAGHAADLVVLDRDPWVAPPEALAEIRVTRTMCAGRWTYSAP